MAALTNAPSPRHGDGEIVHIPKARLYRKLLVSSVSGGELVIWQRVVETICKLVNKPILAQHQNKHSWIDSPLPVSCVGEPLGALRRGVQVCAWGVCFARLLPSASAFPVAIPPQRITFFLQSAQSALPPATTSPHDCCCK